MLRRLRSPRIVVCLVLTATASAFPLHHWWVEHRTESFLDECKAAIEAEDMQALEAASTRWLEWDPESGDAWLFLADASAQQSDFERAAECLDRIDDSHPKCVPALLQRVEILFAKLNRPLDAVATCERILEIEPRATAPYQRLIFFHALTMQPRKMVGWIRLSMDRGREPPEAYPYLLIANSLRFSNGEFVTHKWLQSHPDYEPLLVARAIYNVRGDAGKVIRESGQRPESLKSSSLDDARRRFPENFELLAFDLQKAVDQGDVATVNGLLPRVPENAQLDSRFLRFVGWSHAAGGQLQDALQSYRAAIAADPFDWRARHELANVLRRMSRLDEVATEVELASLGKKLESEVLELKNPSEISGELLGRIADYSNSCGEKKVAARLRRRVSN